MNPLIIPTIQIALSVCAAIGYAFAGDWRRSVYWIAGAVLTFSVTY